MLEQLAAHTRSGPGRALALALQPTADHTEAARRQRETAEAVHLRRGGTELPLGGMRDVRDAAGRARRGAVLTPSELLEVVDTIRSASAVSRLLARLADEVPLLATVGAGIADLEPLRALIAGALTERGEIADSASPELRQIRRELAQAHERLQQRMDQLLRAPQFETALQDRIVTIRDGRYVLPVRTEARSAVPGVVHDTSASGATVYVEPLAVVELGNAWRELQVQERREVERILRELSDAVGEAADELIDAVERLAALDLAAAKARLAREFDADALAEERGRVRWLVPAPAPLVLHGARHPLLTGDVVPVSLEVGGEHDALLITGPNTGGKTVALKTAGLLSLMAMAGLPVPAEAGSTIPVFDAVFADIGDEQSIEQSLSTFSGHVTAIIDILERATARSLVLLDELGAGTDPAEGAALAVAVVERLVSEEVPLIATTHHSELKLYAHRSSRVQNASVEFDVETLSPTYRLTLGLPGQSNALAIAERLGMPDDVIERARQGISSEERDLEGVLRDLRIQLTAAEERAAAAARDRDEAQRLRADLERRLAELAAETEELRRGARDRVRAEVREAERLVERTRRQVESARMEQAAADLERARAAARALAPEPDAERAPQPAGDGGLQLEPGRLVWLRGIPSAGEVLTAPDPDGEFEVQLGALRTRVRASQAVRTAAPGEQPSGQTDTRGATPPLPLGVGPEIEVRGRRVDEALPEVEAFIDRASRAGLERVRIIHGRGTGTLRRAVRDLLVTHPLVASHRSAEPREGGDGVTVVLLAPEGED